MRTLVTVVALFFLGTQAQHDWSYSEGRLEEEEWQQEYPDCGGQSQSPIDVRRGKAQFNSNLKPLNLTGYSEENAEFTMTNNGHTVQIALLNTMCMTDSEGNQYRAQQMHYHWGGGSSEVSGSEHTIDGIRRVMEIHFVHYNAKYKSYNEAKDQPDGLAVLAAFVEIQDYAENIYYSPFISKLASIKYPGQSTTLKGVEIRDMMPVDVYHYYTYNGSLTTPPCTQNVKWFVLQDSIKLSKAQVHKIENSVMNKKNKTLHNGYRKTQPLYNRVVEANFRYYPSKDAQYEFYLRKIDHKISYLTGIVESNSPKRD